MNTESFKEKTETGLANFGAGLCNGLAIGIDPLGAFYSRVSGNYNTEGGEGLLDESDPFKKELVDTKTYAFKSGKLTGATTALAGQYALYCVPQILTGFWDLYRTTNHYTKRHESA